VAWVVTFWIGSAHVYVGVRFFLNRQQRLAPPHISHGALTCRLNVKSKGSAAAQKKMTYICAAIPKKYLLSPLALFTAYFIFIFTRFFSASPARARATGGCSKTNEGHPLQLQTANRQ
jgi:hypothetical protein